MSINITRDRRTLSVADVAEVTGRSQHVVYDALQSGALAGTQSGRRGRWFITSKAVDTWIAAGCPRWAVAS